MFIKIFHNKAYKLLVALTVMEYNRISRLE